MLSAFRLLEEKITAVIREVDGEAKRDAEQALAAVRAEVTTDLAALRGLAGTLENDAVAAVETAGPAVQAAVKAAISKFLASAAPLLAEAATEM